MRVAILPSGALLADAPRGGDEAGDGLSGVARARVARAFGRGPGHALLDLGSTELDAPLVPPLAFLRDLGRAFVTRLCALPDLEVGTFRSTQPSGSRQQLVSHLRQQFGTDIKIVHGAAGGHFGNFGNDRRISYTFTFPRFDTALTTLGNLEFGQTKELEI
jgi:hypothetical protein